VPTPWWHKSEHGAAVEWYWKPKIEGLREKSVSEPLCPPQTPHGLPRSDTSNYPPVLRYDLRADDSMYSTRQGKLDSRCTRLQSNLVPPITLSAAAYCKAESRVSCNFQFPGILNLKALTASWWRVVLTDALRLTFQMFQNRNPTWCKAWHVFLKRQTSWTLSIVYFWLKHTTFRRLKSVSRWIMPKKFVVLTTHHRHKPSEFT
jgi:hypothetical protein